MLENKGMYDLNHNLLKMQYIAVVDLYSVLDAVQMNMTNRNTSGMLILKIV
jgi:hypothetical protein